MYKSSPKEQNKLSLPPQLIEVVCSLTHYLSPKLKLSYFVLVQSYPLILSPQCELERSEVCLVNMATVTVF